MAPIIAIVFFYGFVTNDHRLVIRDLGFAATALLIFIIQSILGAQTRCPLCLTPVLTGKGCSKNRQARTFLGSYRLRVALTVLFKGYFRCPYCNEPTVMEVRVRRLK